MSLAEGPPASHSTTASWPNAMVTKTSAWGIRPRHLKGCRPKAHKGGVRRRSRPIRQGGNHEQFPNHFKMPMSQKVIPRKGCRRKSLCAQSRARAADGADVTECHTQVGG